MKTGYSFLKDELALREIRKHKWIESEKKGQEIGFATAALDWINTHGYAWKQFFRDKKEPGRAGQTAEISGSLRP